MASLHGRAAGLWAITAYFNPIGYRRRLANFRMFRAHLKVPLVAVELAYGADFELGAADAEILIQLRGRDVMWQKERLLNVALRALPRTCDKVVWVDCDIVFERDDWPERVSELVERFSLVHAFRHAHYHASCSQGDEPHSATVEFTRTSIAAAIACGVPALTCFRQPAEPRSATYATGHAWAARRQLADQCSFYDACIIGGGDRALAGAAYGCVDEVMRVHCMNGRQSARYAAWAKPFCHLVDGKVGFLDGSIFHLWHGDMRDRRTGRRHEALVPFAFDPFDDIEIADNGSWRWNSNKPEMHAYLRDYFALRKEDG